MHVEEQRRRGDIVIPKIVMHGLEMPDAFAGIGAQCDNGIGEQVVAEPLATVVIGTGAAGGDENEIAGGIDCNDGPGVGGAGVCGAAVLPGIGSGRTWILRDGIPRPLESSGDDIESANFAARFVCPAVVLDAGTNDQQVSGDDRRRRFFVISESTRRDAQSMPQIEGSVVAEIRTKLTGRGIHGDQAGVDGREKNAPPAIRGFPSGDAACGVIAITHVFVDVRVIRPARIPGEGIERDDATERRGEIERALHIERRGFKLGGLRSVAGRVGVAGAIGPSNLQRLHVRAVDGGQRREALATGVMAIGRPVTVLSGKRQTPHEAGCREEEVRCLHTMCIEAMYYYKPRCSTVPQDLSAATARVQELLERLRETGKLSKFASEDGKQEVTAHFGPLFAPGAVQNLKQEDFKAFLSFKNNRHWHGLDMFSKPIFEDMKRLRDALEILVDENRDIKERFNKLIPKSGQPMVPWLGPARLTPVLQVVYPERYGVLNRVTEEAMKAVGAWPDFPEKATFGERYEAVNKILLELSDRLNIDLWTLDSLWTKVKSRTSDDSQELKQAESLEDSPEEAAGDGEGGQYFALEKYLKEFLSDNWDHLDLGKEWKIYLKDGDPVGLEFNTNEVGKIDILARHRNDPRWLVIELKRNQPGDGALGQLQRYMGWVKKNLGQADEVHGSIICRKVDQKALLRSGFREER